MNTSQAPSGAASAPIDEQTDGAPPPPRFVRWVTAYPVAFLAIAGLAAGLLVTFVGRQPVAGGYVWYATLVIGGIPLVYATARRLARREFASDVIATLAILGAILLDQPFAGVIIVLMQSGGEAIEDFAHRRATASLDRLVRRAPRWAYRYDGEQLVRLPVEQVRPGDRLGVRSGDIVPVDGTVASDSAVLDESSVTGEALPRSRSTGTTILSGAVNVGPAFDLLALRTSQESQYARIVELVRSAQARKPSIQRLADRYAVWFTPTAVIVAVLAAVIQHNPLTGLAVLVVATPCPLILATPIAVLQAIDRAAERGIVAKSGATIEEIGRAQVVLFDKTGTLTLGSPEVDRIVTVTDWPPEELLTLVAAVERFSSHPIAESVVRRAKGRAVPAASQHHEFPGAGVSALVEDHRVVVGSRSLCERVIQAPFDRVADAVARSGDTTGRLVSYVAIDGTPAGAILFADPVRPEVPGLADRLRRLGIREVGILTGDNRANAEAVAREAGITSVEAELLPEQKVARVGAYRRRFGSTIMVGDGINDAAALATASVGIAMGARGAGISAEAADAVLLVDDLTAVADGIALGQRMLRIARQGILFGLGASLVLMGIASFGFIAPANGALIQEALDVAVIFNALRVR